MSPGVSNCYYRDVPPSISFSGSGFMATYQLGVSQCFLNYAPWILHTAPFVLGASAGSLAAAAVVCEMSLISIRDEMLHFAKQMKAFTLGPFNPSINVFHWLEFILHKHLPSNAHQLASGRLAVGMTRMTDKKNIIMSDFESKEDVVQALLCSCFVPGYCGMIAPSFKGVHYMDGGFSSMQPVLPSPCSQILKVSPFSGEADICPADTPSMWDMVVSGTTLKGNMANGLRIINALYPMTLQNLGEAYENGYKDAARFLLSNDIVPYLTIHEEFQRPLNQNKIWAHQETNTEKEEETNVQKETTTLTFFTDVRCKQRGSSAEYESAGKLLHIDLLKNGLLDTLNTSASLYQLPAFIVYHLFLPLMLTFYTALQSGYRLELLFRQIPELMFWAWQLLRYHTIFISNIFLCSLKKNMKEWSMPFSLLLKWVKIQVQFEIKQEKKLTKHCPKLHSAAQSEDVRHWSPHSRFHHWIKRIQNYSISTQRD